ncbi:MAG: manganese efflux pump [Planctomycetes bacterium]|nr:manganese efflux pump [Planctomycetota bacterium]
MSWLNLLGISVGLAMDAFAVSIVAGLRVAPVTRRHTFRLAFHFGLFQFMMPIFGWLAGKKLVQYIEAYDHWIAFGLLAFVGGKMLLEAFSEKDSDFTVDPTRGWMLVALSLATSLDAFAVGLSMALFHVSVWIPSVVIGLVAAALSAVGAVFGGYLGRRCGRWAELAGGCVLVLIGLRILVAHLGA